MSPHGFTVYDMIARGALAFADAPAVIQGEQVLSFRQFRDRVDALAAGLAALGIGRGERVCVLAQNDAAYLELYGACARQGIVAYPINWRLTAAEVERVVERAAPAMFVADASTLGTVADWPATRRSVRHWYQLGAAAAPGFTPLAHLYRAGAPPPADVEADDVFAVISTAAVDVVPRGAALTHANVLVANLAAMACFGYGPGDRYLLALPLFHITALGTALAHLHARRLRRRGALRGRGSRAAHRPSRDHAPVGLSPRPRQRARRRRQARQPAAQPARRGRTGRAAHDPAAARDHQGQVLDRLRPVGDERLRDAAARPRPTGGGRSPAAARHHRPGGRLRPGGAGR